jgi:hypothetical protein
MSVHHLLEQILNEYIAAAGLQSGQPLFQSVNSLGTAVTGRALNRYNAWAAIRKRAKAAGFLTPVGCGDIPKMRCSRKVPLSIHPFHAVSASGARHYDSGGPGDLHWLGED